MSRVRPGCILAISTYRNDEAVLQTLVRVSQPECAELFDKVLVVDSQGTGTLPRAIAERGWSPWIDYRSFDFNLGSAGNLSTRLRLAGETDADWALALNHDGEIDPKVVGALLDTATECAKLRLGAVYPLRWIPGKQAYDLTGTVRVPLRFVGTAERPIKSALSAYWSSSNGALYALDPVRKGLLPPGDFWMGWEDLEYGWQLAEAGYVQLISSAAEWTDDYECADCEIMGRRLRVTRKPPWYTYYFARNLLLTAARHPRPFSGPLLIGCRLAMECAAIALLRDHKGKRAQLFVAGLSAALQSHTGKGPVP